MFDSRLAEKSLEYRYALLDRLKVDARYCKNHILEVKEDGSSSSIDYSQFLSKHLWGGLDNHFETIEGIWRSFDEKEQPNWYSLRAMMEDKRLLEELTHLSIG